ncbi:hypothetical protein [Winogradskyella sediminis]|uniref:Uncharacterized protein n=1 Tax=Winogradskyella sediminis TaxID=1382466 RepID=A0A1H1THF2_9FLAO|nr:hypothetical protein [Winogradskyella sediminis]REG88981.1 hypothetical protein C8N41_101216 [Winogradskyella sediminis]SDS59630.1 hypothetical protein SAMN04489797_1950 [Winogradskyella sediminis]
MKKGLFIILFLTMSLASFAQQDVIVNNEKEVIETSKTVKSESSDAAISSEIKAKVLKMNRKKNTEIISIKTFRKSLQIRVKTVKLC